MSSLSAIFDDMGIKEPTTKFWFIKGKELESKYEEAGDLVDDIFANNKFPTKIIDWIEARKVGGKLVVQLMLTKNVTYGFMRKMIYGDYLVYAGGSRKKRERGLISRNKKRKQPGSSSRKRMRLG